MSTAPDIDNMVAAEGVTATTWIRLRDGEWGVRCAGEFPTRSTAEESLRYLTALVTNKAGNTRSVILNELVAHFADATLWKIEQ